MEFFEQMYRPITPPYTDHLQALGSAHSRSTSGSSLFCFESSPDSVDTSLTTPVKSPIMRHGAPILLPKVRPQDQVLESTEFVKGHRKALSNTPNLTDYALMSARPRVQRSLTSPPECRAESASPTNSLLSPDHNTGLIANTSITVTSSQSRKSLGAHARSVSTSNIDVLGRFGYPYRQLPIYTPSSTTGSSTFVPPPMSIPNSREQILVPELQYSTEYIDTPTLTLLDYLTAPNPAPSLIPPDESNYPSPRFGEETHCWWDVRNLRTWDSFNLNSIARVPNLMQLLTTEVPASALPTPAYERNALRPTSEPALHSLLNTFYATKVNAALRLALGQPPLFLYPGDHSLHGSRAPDFLANYRDDTTATILSGTRKARVVGHVMAYEQWHTTMRSGPGNEKVKYLAGLARLHWSMREHGCRYGFIITETELLCVRAGTERVPYFGLLDLAPVIEVKTSYSDLSVLLSICSGADGPVPATSKATALTAPLALWYLHMLAKEHPFPGEPYYKLEVGGPLAVTRQNVLPERDSWMPTPQNAELRRARNTRGWKWPTDKISPKERKRGQRGRIAV